MHLCSLKRVCVYIYISKQQFPEHPIPNSQFGTFGTPRPGSCGRLFMGGVLVVESERGSIRYLTLSWAGWLRNPNWKL